MWHFRGFWYFLVIAIFKLARISYGIENRLLWIDVLVVVLSAWTMDMQKNKKNTHIYIMQYWSYDKNLFLRQFVFIL